MEDQEALELLVDVFVHSLSHVPTCTNILFMVDYVHILLYGEIMIIYLTYCARESLISKNFILHIRILDHPLGTCISCMFVEYTTVAMVHIINIYTNKHTHTYI